MPTLEEVIRDSKLKVHPQKEFPSLEITARSEVPKVTSSDSLEGLNELCREMDFPVIEERMLSDHLALLDVLNNLNIEYGRYGLSFSSELDEVRERQEKISLYNMHEKECDILEVDLANLREEHDRMCEYRRYDIETLRSRLDGLKKAFNDAEYERLHPNLVNKVSMLLTEGGPVDEEVVGALSYVKESKEYSSAIEKMVIMDEIERIPDSYDKFIFKKLILEDFVSLDDLGRTLNLDRTALLKTVYSLLSRNIIVFNRSKDTISLQR